MEDIVLSYIFCSCQEERMFAECMFVSTVHLQVEQSVIIYRCNNITFGLLTFKEVCESQIKEQSEINSDNFDINLKNFFRQFINTN